MSGQEYEELWHYSKQFTKDKLQRSELVTMARQTGVKLGKRCSMGLMKSINFEPQRNLCIQEFQELLLLRSKARNQCRTGSYKLFYFY